MHLRLAAQFGILFALLTGLCQVLWTGWGDAPRVFVTGAIGGLAFGILMSAILGSMHWRAATAARDRRLAADPAASPVPEMGVTITRTVLVPLPAGEILSRGTEAAALSHARVRRIDETAGTITLITSTSWRSWGERIVLATDPDESGNTAVTITSGPRLRGTLIDYGRNATNVERLGEWLRGLSR